MLPLQASVDLGAMVIKEYSAFLKAPALLEPHHQIVQCHIQDAHTLTAQNVFDKAKPNNYLFFFTLI